jgi:hypothetical protein
LEVGSSSSIGVDYVPAVMSVEVHVVVLSLMLPYAAPPDRLLNGMTLHYGSHFSIKNK